MSHAVVLSGSLLAFLGRGCCLLGEHRRQLGPSDVTPDVTVLERGHGQMESCDGIWEHPLFSGETVSGRRMWLKP